MSSCPRAEAASPALSSGRNAGMPITNSAPRIGPASRLMPPITHMTTTSIDAFVGKTVASSCDSAWP